MEFRHTETDPPVEMSVYDFCKMVSEGKIKPTALYRTLWTSGEWRTVDNLLPFHRSSPVKYPMGKKLVEEIVNEQRRKQRFAEISNRDHQYMYGTLIEDSYRLPSLDCLPVGGQLLGAARFIVLPSFVPERVFTVAFREADIVIDAVCGKSSLWGSLPRVSRTTSDGLWEEDPGVPFHPDQALRATANISCHDVPDVFLSWQGFADRVAQLPSCMTPTLDGIGYRHKLNYDQRLIDVTWDNPDRTEHSAQMAIIVAYEQILKAAGLGEFLKVKRRSKA
jgi:hypothetical protein